VVVVVVVVEVVDDVVSKFRNKKEVGPILKLSNYKNSYNESVSFW